MFDRTSCFYNWIIAVCNFVRFVFDSFVSERMQLFQQLPSSQHLVMGTKRGRFLMRQQRIKRESDSNQALDADCSPQYLSVPQSYRIERQTSDPLPSSSPPASLNLLTVPGGGMLVKQHSHPLLPSQTQSQVKLRYENDENNLL